MFKNLRRIWLCAMSGATLALGSCYTSAQLHDFGRTEVARVISDVFGQFVFNSLLAGSSNPSNFQ